LGKKPGVCDTNMKFRTDSAVGNSFSRRRFLETAAKAASVAVLGPSFFGVSTALAAGSFVRRDIAGLAPGDPILMSYRKAIKAMQALPASNPLSWTYQAAIHGNTVLPPLAAWNTCEHGTYFFWSWHRMYLYWFERIIRKMSGDYGWALPYWNWSSASERQLPAAFRDPTSELYTSHRNSAMNSGAGSLPASDVSYTTAFSFVNFASASSSLEGTPHGAVHVDVGGWMGSVPTAAQDPIFYLHHCNIDRLWNLWLRQGGGRTDPLSDNTWKTSQFLFFDANGAQVKMTGCEVLRAAEQLNYTYEGEPTQIREYCLKIFKPSLVFQTIILLHLPIPEFILGSEPVSFPIDIKQLRERLVSIAESKTETLLLELDRVEAERQPGVVWEVYVGLPANAKPDPKSPYYVGNLALFGSGIRSEVHHGFKPAHFAFPVGRAVMTSLKGREDQLQVTFVPHGVLVDGKPTHPNVESPVRVGQASLAVETQKRQ
jgi:hypothetical protein